MKSHKSIRDHTTLEGLVFQKLKSGGGNRAKRTIGNN